VALTGTWYMYMRQQGEAPELRLRETLWAGICSGFFWRARASHLRCARER
jgi:hypothetical protein